MEKQRKIQDRMNGAFETMSEAEAAYGITIWFGAIFFYLLFFGKTPFNKLYTKRYKTRNLIVGYILNLSLAASILFLFYYLETLE